MTGCDTIAAGDAWHIYRNRETGVVELEVELELKNPDGVRLCKERREHRDVLVTTVHLPNDLGEVLESMPGWPDWETP